MNDDRITYRQLTDARVNNKRAAHAIENAASPRLDLAVVGRARSDLGS